MSQKIQLEKESIVNASASKIDAIKELIFGEELQTYNSQLKSLKDDINKQREELEDLRKELLQNIDNLNTDLNIRISNLDDEFKNMSLEQDNSKLDKKVLGDLLIKLGETIAR